MASVAFGFLVLVIFWGIANAILNEWEEEER